MLHCFSVYCASILCCDRCIVWFECRTHAPPCVGMHDATDMATLTCWAPGMDAVLCVHLGVPEEYLDCYCFALYICGSQMYLEQAHVDLCTRSMVRTHGWMSTHVPAPCIVFFSHLLVAFSSGKTSYNWSPVLLKLVVLFACDYYCLQSKWEELPKLIRNGHVQVRPLDMFKQSLRFSFLQP